MKPSAYSIACLRADLRAAYLTAKFLPRAERRAMIYRAASRYAAAKVATE